MIASSELNDFRVRIDKAKRGVWGPGHRRPFMPWRWDMAGLIRQLALGTFVLLAAINTQAGAQNITHVTSQNAAVNAAIAKAKSTLPVFFVRNAKPQPGDSGFAVKIRYDTGKGDGSGEHIWAGDVVHNGDKVTATIANEPQQIANLTKGQRVTVPVSQLTDWMYIRDDKYHGAYTVRALVPFMRPAQAAAMRKRLAPE
jgi:uncharacterized protein YegJ (DUF2314 family)